MTDELCSTCGSRQVHGRGMGLFCPRCDRMRTLDQIPSEFVTWVEDVAKIRMRRVKELVHDLVAEQLRNLGK